MFYLIPYRAKNPPEQFPYATLSLILLNTLIYACTTNHFLIIRQSTLDTLAFSHSCGNPLLMISAMFLHANLLHLLGNMLFLWLFGASVEGRLKPLKFLIVYFAAGLIGFMLEDVTVGLINPDMPNVGASGAIMGLGGAYLYMFPYATICVAWSYWISLLPKFGLSQWHARWVILFYIGLDIINEVIASGGDGVAHFAHLGGFGAGIVGAAMLNAHRDSLDKSDAQAIRADVKDYEYMSYTELAALMEHPTDDPKLVVAYCDKVLAAPYGPSDEGCLSVLQHYGPLLLEKAEPTELSAIILRLSLECARRMPLLYLLQLGSKLEKNYANDMAVRLYRRITEINPTALESQTALFRLGRLMEHVFMNLPEAQRYYQDVLRHFPDSALAVDARLALNQLARHSHSH